MGNDKDAAKTMGNDKDAAKTKGNDKDAAKTKGNNKDAAKTTGKKLNKKANSPTLKVITRALDVQNPKFTNGKNAREEWSRNIDPARLLSMAEYNKQCGNVFVKAAEILLDNSSERQTVIQVNPTDATWNEHKEKIYTIVKNGKVVKIGGTRNGMKHRFTSYLCGHHVTERGKSGKMSVTNAHLYHSIEKDLLDMESKWEFYTWELPITTIQVTILGENTKIAAQTYHAYESRCIEKYKNMTGNIPIFCHNCDPDYIK